MIPFALGGLALGLAIGILIGRSFSSSARSRVKELQRELDRAETELHTYRSTVGQHFSETGDLLKNLALNLCDTYEHIAEGARVLCPDEIKTLRPGHAAEELLLAGSPSVDTETPVAPLETDEGQDAPSEFPDLVAEVPTEPAGETDTGDTETEEVKGAS